MNKKQTIAHSLIKLSQYQKIGVRITLKDNILIISSPVEGFIVYILYSIMMLLLLTFGIFSDENTLVFFILFFSLLFFSIKIFFEIAKGENNVEINFQERTINIKNQSLVFKKIMKSKVINFTPENKIHKMKKSFTRYGQNYRLNLRTGIESHSYVLFDVIDEELADRVIGYLNHLVK